MGFTITRQIGIDAGHRIASHGSKCRHLHGHRYLVEACCRTSTGKLRDQGEQAGMVLDFGFLKEEMMAHVDAPCDHGLILDLADHPVLSLFTPTGMAFEDWLERLSVEVREQGHVETSETLLDQKLYIVPFPPTAEWLAKHWFERLAPAVRRRSDGLAILDHVTVWETPNCQATYRDTGAA
ncbi:6-pyruvoyl tetrahydropterin synthase [Skermanella stibiiresistens SB22]|uniref:6-carboxy-5,6,7,8-tetrahydropterin synthase n=1 Tax=Skermanella stibiiresistens SB22 TaxID=1385369 RepID=W9GPE1_9PROT|nr:6-carboxytetrahydropterin synthase [Skermanella stibiiresistens]EWY35745.1 6-pyruvoyl tetrahydropterin synthase [Skermanella stibiiresistens SB22]